MDPEDARLALDVFHRLDLPIIGAQLSSVGSLNRDAFEVAHRLGCSFFDATFIALADRLDTQVLTADERLYERVKDKTNRLLWISEFQLP
jgi:predicted nucleic acid-binding protein